MMDVPTSVREAIERKRLVFTVTTGRSGTQFLARLFQRRVRGLTSVHETDPNFVEVMRDAQHDPKLATRFLAQRKLPAVAEDPNPIYFEASHLFCKGFAEPLLDLGFGADLILLSRTARAVASSLYLVETIPGRTRGGLKWYLSPDDPDVLRLARWQELDDYCLCYWYCLEIARRQDLYERLYRERGARVLRITLDEANTFLGFRRLHRLIARREPSPHAWWRFATRRRKPVNEKLKQKKRRERTLPPDLPALERAVLDRVGASPEAESFDRALNVGAAG